MKDGADFGPPTIHCLRWRNLPALVSLQRSLREYGEQLRAARALGTSSSCFAAVAGDGWLVIAVALLSLPLCNIHLTSLRVELCLQLYETATFVGCNFSRVALKGTLLGVGGSA